MLMNIHDRQSVDCLAVDRTDIGNRAMFLRYFQDEARARQITGMLYEGLSRLKSRMLHDAGYVFPFQMAVCMHASE